MTTDVVDITFGTTTSSFSSSLSYLSTLTNYNFSLEDKTNFTNQSQFLPNLLTTDVVQPAPSSTVPESYYYAVREFRFITMGTIICLGLLLNLICISVFLSSAMKKTGVGHYLIALAVADFTLLVGEFIWWLNFRQEQQPRIGRQQQL